MVNVVKMWCFTSVLCGVAARKTGMHSARLRRPLDYLIYGREAKQVVVENAWLTGLATMPSLWPLRFQQSRYSYFRGLGWRKWRPAAEG
jgi:hypothetical protein